MKKIQAKIAYPLDVSFEVPDGSDPDFIWKEIIRLADDELKKGETAPVILQCDQLNNSNIKIPDSQAEWIDAALVSLQKSKESLSYALSVKSLIKQEISEKIAGVNQQLDDTIAALMSSVSSVN